MRTSGNTVLVTGGATGIGFALAEAFVREHNAVIICGRREHRLCEAQEKLPGIHIRRCDLAKSSERKALYEWATGQFSTLNILVNNAGIQRSVDFMQGAEALLSGEDEIEINLQAPIHLSALFIPLLLKQEEAAIINISSGLGFVPFATFPVYCATKAALHSFSWTLRHQLRASSIRVVEVIPPTVRSALNAESRRRRGMQDAGMDPAAVAAATLRALAEETYEVAVGEAEWLRMAARTEPDEAFRRMNGD